MRRGWRAGVGRRDVAVVAAVSVALVADALLCPQGNLTPAAVPALALIAGPLAWRTVAPRTVLAIVVVGVFVALATFKPVNVVSLAPMVAAYTVALQSDRLRSLVLAVLAVIAAVVCVLLYSDSDSDLVDAILNGTYMLLAVATGDAVRSRRAYRAAAAEREAERAREQEEEALRLVAEERLRIAREVHDVVAHAMVAINVQAGVAAHVLDRRPDQARTALREIKAASGAALTDLRATLGLLRDDGAAAPVAPAASLAGVPELALALRAAGVEVDVSVVGDVGRVPSAVGAAAHRIVQEACTNVLRHAGAHRASIAVAVRPAGVEVVVEDDGAAVALVGAGPGPGPGSGNGLRGMAERADALGGRVEARPRDDGSGWRVRAWLPIP